MTKALIMLLMAGKLGKFLITGGTMLLSIFTYAIFYGWQYAIGLVTLIFAHEMGHYIAARQSNLNVGAPCFIPFVGAWINLKEQPMNAEVEAYVGIAGPILGSVAAFICYLIGQKTGSTLMLAIAYSGFMLNLFNLIPISPLDGGRIVSVVSPRIWLLGIPILTALFLWQPSPLLLIIAIFAVPQLFTTLRQKNIESTPYFNTDNKIRISYSVQYLLLVATLSVIAYQIHEQMGSRNL